jgi:hypothetical protein
MTFKDKDPSSVGFVLHNGEYREFPKRPFVGRRKGSKILTRKMTKTLPDGTVVTETERIRTYLD